MEIANPIYDAVFKFMMEDKKVAMLLIGTITGYDILDVELRPTEVVLDGEGKRQWTVYRLDLAVKVDTPEGQRIVLVEIQKAKLHTDIMRFRRYLGSQYSSSENYEEIVDSKGMRRARALPIFTIYILGHRLPKNSDIPVIVVNRCCVDKSSKEVLAESDEFIESLTHDCAVIQVPALKERRRNRLERVLAVFDQAQINPQNHHLLQVNLADYPEECQVIIARLLLAVADKEVRQRMIVEDEIISEFEEWERREQRLTQMAEEALKREEEACKREEEERRLKEEARKHEEEARKREEEARKHEEEARNREEEARNREEEARKREEEERRIKEAALGEIEELKRKLRQYES